MMDIRTDTRIYHWLPDEDRWESLLFEEWSAFRGILAPNVGLPRLGGGVHHFIVAVLDDDRGLVNLIPHKYLVEPNGKIGRANFSGLNKEERDDLDRLYRIPEFEPGDEERLNEIRAKNPDAHDPPREAIGPLKWALPTPPKPGSAAERFLARYR